MPQKSSRSQRKIPAAGEIRQSQILSTYGPGSMVDLPTKSVIIGGLNHWRFPAERQTIEEKRLKGYICKKLGLPRVELYEPPASNTDPTAPRTGIQCFTFPTWFVGQVDQRWPNETTTGKSYRTRPLLPWGQLVQGKYLDENRKKHPVVPVRFVQACINGHISDIDWRAFVHRGDTTCRNQLWLDEGGMGNDFADIFARCECGKRRALSDATIPNSKALGDCKGDRPWLGQGNRDFESRCCSQETGRPNPNRLLVRSASNAYFAQMINVISLPSSNEALREAVSLVYDSIRGADSVDELRIFRKIPNISNALENFSDEAVWAELQRQISPAIPEDKTPKQVEIETLLSQPDELGEDVTEGEGEFYARNRSLKMLSAALKGCIERIVLVHRLREVTAQVGFTRFEPAIQDIDGDLKLDVGLADLDIETTWLPAVENKGEGFFLAFQQEAIDQWLSQEAVKQRAMALKRGFDIWRQRKGIDSSKLSFPGAPYIMLHSLSHLLITAVSLECGYSASAIRERIYAGESGYGILLYTGSTGSEGTLGGLVEVGRHIEKYLIDALEMGKLCSNDPVCAQHVPEATYEERFLHGAACHGCLLISETSCERRNESLDRALVVNTVENLGAAFFPDNLQ